MNQKTLIGAGIGFIIGILGAPFVFGAVFGMLFFFGNAILFGLKIIQNGPVLIEFLYTGFAAALITPLAGLLIGARVGKSLK
jgi:hypothetical protein